MHALVKKTALSRDVAVVDKEPPELLPGHLLVRTEACGLCGSDVHAWRGDKGYEWLTPPVTFGHEAVGRVIAVGPSVSESWIGRQIVPIAIDGCGKCATCRQGRRQICPDRSVLGLSFDGAAAETFTIPEHRAVTVEVDLSPEILALTEPVSVAYHAVRRLEKTEGASISVVVSGPGPIGMTAALLLSQRGHEVALVGAERDRDGRLATAASLGLQVFVADEARDLTPDGWLEASGSSHALNAALRQTMPGGTVIVAGLFGEAADADINLLTRREISLRGSYGSQAQEYRQAMEVLSSNPKLWASLLTTCSLSDGIEALEATAAGQAFKIVLLPDAGSSQLGVTDVDSRSEMFSNAYLS